MEALIDSRNSEPYFAAVPLFFFVSSESRSR